MQSHPSEELLLPGHIPRGNNKDPLGWLREVAPRRSSRLFIPKMSQYVMEFPPCPCVIRVPRLCGPGVCLPKLSYEGKYSYGIGNHGKGVSLGHALLSVQEVTRPVPCVSHHHGGPVVVAVKGKLRATRPLISYSPKHCCPVLLI